MVKGIFRSTQKPVPETLETAPAPFRLILKTFGAFKPGFVVVVVIDDLQSQSRCVTGSFVLPDEVFLLRPDVRVAVINDRLPAVCQHPFNNGRLTGGAAGMEQNLSHSRRKISQLVQITQALRGHIQYCRHAGQRNQIMLYLQGTMEPNPIENGCRNQKSLHAERTQNLL